MLFSRNAVAQACQSNVLCWAHVEAVVEARVCEISEERAVVGQANANAMREVSVHQVSAQRAVIGAGLTQTHAGSSS